MLGNVLFSYSILYVCCTEFRTSLHTAGTLCSAMFSVAVDGVNLRGPDTGPGGNEMSVYSAEFLTPKKIYPAEYFTLQDILLCRIFYPAEYFTLQNILLC